MRIRLLLAAPDVRCDVVVDAPPGTTVADLRPVVAELSGTLPDLAWWSGSRPLPAHALVGGPGLRAGDEVSLGAPGTDRVGAGSLHLAVVAGPGAGTLLPLARGVHVLGRDAGCDLVLPGAEASRRHAAVTVSAAGVTVRDLDSRNGTVRGAVRVDRDGDDLDPGDALRLGHSTVELRATAPERAPVRATTDGRVLVLRRAPVRPPAPPATVRAPDPPPEPARARAGWVAAVVPLVVALALAWWLHTWVLLFLALAAPVTLLVTGVVDRGGARRDPTRTTGRRGRRRSAADAAADRRRFERARAGLLARDRAARLAPHPDPATCLALATGPAAGLWSRSAGTAACWQVRVGTADRPSVTQVVAGDGPGGPLGTVVGVPCCADLARGPLGVAGPPPHSTAVVRAVLTQLTVAHPPGALAFVVLQSDPLDRTWDWLRWLPHEVRRAATPEDHAAVTTDLLARVTGGGPALAGPTVVVLADRAGALADLTGLNEVLARGTGAGVLAVCLDPVVSALPAACATVVEVTGPTLATLSLDGAGWDTSDGRPDVLGPVLADQVTSTAVADLARALAPLAEGSGDDGLPDTVDLLDLLRLDGPDEVVRRWQVAGVDPSLRATVGTAGGGDAVLDLTADGPHALVGGTTGSGKSALLQTWVAALAVDHPPDQLAFLLVDYKGGSAFGACARLPHTQGLVTDLDPHLTSRVLRSLDAELRRRERAFAAAGAADLPGYRRAGGGPAVPRLVVVVDEFATLAADLPDFVPGLVDVAQRGRSLGVHLVLATQRPGAAVSPAIRANATLRVALRVTGPAESVDVVDVPDAASLDPRRPGRAVVRTGRGHETVQVAHVGATVGDDAAGEVSVRAVAPWEHAPPPPPTVTTRTALDEVVDLVGRAWGTLAGAGHTLPAPLWTRPLPEVVTVDDLGDAGADPLRVVLGLRDEPDRQRQVTELLDLAAGGTLLLVGAPRSGRSTALRTVAVAAAAAGVPTVVVDRLASSRLGGPAVVAHVDHEDTVTLLRLLDRVEAEVAARRVASGQLPPLLLLVDDVAAVTTALDDLDGGRAGGRWRDVLRAAGSTAVTVVATGDASALAPRTVAVADQVWLLRTGDAADAVRTGLTPRDVPTDLPPGRAVRAPDGAQVQLVVPPPPGRLAPVVPTLTGLLVRPLPDRVAPPPGRPGPEGLRLGAGGDTAGPVTADPWRSGGRWLVAGPPRSGRSSVLARLAAEAAAAGAVVRWWAPPHSPLADLATARGWAALQTEHDTLAPDPLGGRLLVVLDDVDRLADTTLSEAAAAALRTSPPGRLAVVVAGRAEELLVGFRGVVAEVRRGRRGLLLAPGPGDGELLGIRTGRAEAGPPGRGVLVADGVTVDGRRVEVGPLPVQVALPPAAVAP